MARNPLSPFAAFSGPNSTTSTRSSSPAARSEYDWVDVLAPNEIGLPTHSHSQRFEMNATIQDNTGIGAPRRRGAGIGALGGREEEEREKEMVDDDSGKGAKEERPSGIGMESRFPPEPSVVRQTKDRAGRYSALNETTPRTLVRPSFPHI